MNALKELLYDNFGVYKERQNQLIFKRCPFCENTRWNFEINTYKKVYHDWVCDIGGSLYQLFNVFNINYDLDLVQESENILKKEDSFDVSSYTKIPYKKYQNLFKNKGLTEDDIKKYNFLYGLFKNYGVKLIIPLYEGRKLVYYIARDLTLKGNYYNIDREKKNILPYYLGTKNILQLYLCEGVFDAIVINKLGYSAGILLGTHLFEEQIKKIIKFGFEEIIIFLDGDALKKALIIYKKLWLYSIKCKIITNIGEKEDPNSLYVKEKQKLLYLLNSPQILNFEDEVRLELNV